MSSDSTRGGFDPVGNFNFEVEIDGITNAIFSGVDGLNYEVEMIEYRDAANPLLPLYRPGHIKVGRVTLKGGYRCKLDLIDWIKKAEEGKLERKSISIWLSDNAGSRVKGWNLFNCMPTKWSVSSFDGKGNEIVIETIELVAEQIKMVNV